MKPFDRFMKKMNEKHWADPIDEPETLTKITNEFQALFPGVYNVRIGRDQWDYLHIYITHDRPEDATFFKLKWG